MPRTSPCGLVRAVAVAVASALLDVPDARSQTTGTLVGVVSDAATGVPVAGAAVIAIGRQLPGEQVATTAEDGTWRIAFLPPGPYSLRLVAPGYVEAERADLHLKPDHTLKVVMPLVPSSVTLDEQVVRVGAQHGVDPTSAQTGLVIPREFVAALPLPVSGSLVVPSSRSFETAALAAAGAETDPMGVGFLGASSTENRYLVGGFDVTDPVYGVNLAPLLVDFIEEVDVKTGNFMPKYGRASGGIVSAITKSGSNEVHGTVFSNLSPRWAFQPDGNFTGRDGQAFWVRDAYSRGAYDADVGVELGGPIVRDRLWFHFGFAPGFSRNVTERTLRANVLPDALGACPEGASAGGDGLCRDADGAALQEEIPSATRRFATDTRSYQFTGKLTWLPTPDHTVTLSTFGAPFTRARASRTFAEPVDAYAADGLRSVDTREIVGSVTANWKGRFLGRRLLVEALAGWIVDDLTEHGPATAQDAPAMSWFGAGGAPLPLSLFEPVPSGCGVASERCVVAGYLTGNYAYREDVRTDRLNARLSASYLFSALGAHASELGVDVERVSSRTTTLRPSGARYTMVVTPSGTIMARANGQGAVQTDPASGEQVPVWTDQMAFAPNSISPAVYVQDQWQPHPSLTVNAGVRWESQSLRDDLWRSAVDLRFRNAIAPRAQIVWDPTGRGRSEIAAAWGRFYDAPSLDLVNVAPLAGFSARYACPAGTPIGTGTVNPRSECPLVEGAFGGESYYAPETVRPVAPDVGAPYVDQFVISAEYDVWRDVSVGIEYQGRRLGAVVEDMATEDLGLYYLANPGVSEPFTFGDVVLDPRHLDGIDASTGRAYSTQVSPPQRSYDGITLKVTKLSARGLFGHAAYTLSQLRGDYAGPLQLDYDQYFQPSQTADYDSPDYLPNRRGLLPGDRTHTIRLYGGYRWLPTSRLGLTIGAGVNTRSGTPVDVRGWAPTDEIGYEGSLAFLVPRGRGGRTPWVTQIDLRGQLDYTLTPPWALRFTIDAFNVLDSRTALEVDERYTMNDQVASISGAPCSGNPASARDPARAVAAACPDLAYLRTVDGRPAAVNRNWGRPTEYQLPLLLRFGVALAF